MIYVTGDMHGSEDRLFDREWLKLKAGDVLLVCGDFGYLWDGSEREKQAVDYIASRKFTVAFVDGAHENFDLLNRQRATMWKGGLVHRIKGNLLHLMRGQIYNIDGTRIFTFGGGESPDKDMRIEQGFWWREELPEPSEMALGAKRLDEEGCSVDYIITHEPPLLVKSAMLVRNGYPERISKLNGYLEEIGNACTFKQWFFGSMHEDRQVTAQHTCVFQKVIPIDSKNRT